jgi:hypothetical protein
MTDIRIPKHDTYLCTSSAIPYDRRKSHLPADLSQTVVAISSAQKTVSRTARCLDL